jgi:hypothetical protein
VTPDDVARNGKIVFAGQQTLTNPDGKRLELNERTPEIASISKVFTSGVHYMLHGPYEGTLGGWLGSKLTMSRSVADLNLRISPSIIPDWRRTTKGVSTHPA